MPADWRGFLSELFDASETEQRAWLAEHPLRAILQDKAVGEIRRSSLVSNDPPKDGEPFKVVLRWQDGPVAQQVILPSEIDYLGLQFVAATDARNYLIVFETDQGTITTNPQEFHRVMGAYRSPELDTHDPRQRFLGLSNACVEPVYPPQMPAFTSRHFGTVAPDTYGDSDASLHVARLSDRPLQVMIRQLGAQDGEAIDGVMDRFLAGLDDLLDASTPDVIENMLHFVEAVYRDPKGPVPTHGVDEGLEKVLNHGAPSGIWRHVEPYMLVLARNGTIPEPPAEQRIADGPIYVTLHCHCDWEIEHGLGLVWRDGTVLSAVGDHSVRLEDGRLKDHAV